MNSTDLIDKWLVSLDHLSEASRANYKTWVNGLGKYLLNSKTGSPNTLEKALLQNNKWIDIIAQFLDEGDVLYAKTVRDHVATWLNGINNQPGWKDRRSAFNSFSDFLDKGIADKALVGNGAPNPTLDNYRKLFNKPDLHKIDGVEALAELLGYGKLIEMAVAESYFFDNKLVQDRHNELCSMFEEDKEIPVRKTTQTNLSYPCRVSVDRDGNKPVRELIKAKTGYVISSGEKSNFQNYVISHVWGNAYLPQYFTNLWNIVLIPSWANPLMDKNGMPGSLASRFKATIMAICQKYYGMGNLNWNGLKMQSSDVNVVNAQDVCPGKYQINVIGELPTPPFYRSQVARIAEKSVKV